MFPMDWTRVHKAFLFFFKILFIYLTEGERDHKQAKKQTERGGSMLPAEQKARRGARSQDPGIMT